MLHAALQSVAREACISRITEAGQLHILQGPQHRGRLAPAAAKQQQQDWHMRSGMPCICHATALGALKNEELPGFCDAADACLSAHTLEGSMQALCQGTADVPLTGWAWIVLNSSSACRRGSTVCLFRKSSKRWYLLALQMCRPCLVNGVLLMQAEATSWQATRHYRPTPTGST